MKAMNHYLILTEADMLAFGAQLAAIIPVGTVVYLEGSLGAGKTTLVRGFLRGLGHLAKVKSPTYTLVEPYAVPSKTLFHFDLYRLTHPQELVHIGIEEYFTANTICLIEWPEKGGSWLPPADLACYIAFTAVGREIRLEGRTIIGQEILKQLSK